MSEIVSDQKKQLAPGSLCRKAWYIAWLPAYLGLYLAEIERSNCMKTRPTPLCLTWKACWRRKLTPSIVEIGLPHCSVINLATQTVDSVWNSARLTPKTYWIYLFIVSSQRDHRKGLIQLGQLLNLDRDCTQTGTNERKTHTFPVSIRPHPFTWVTEFGIEVIFYAQSISINAVQIVDGMIAVCYYILNWLLSPTSEYKSLFVLCWVKKLLKETQDFYQNNWIVHKR